MTTMMLRPLLRAALCAATIAVSLHAAAQTYPAKPVTLIIPYAVGTVTEAFGRSIAQRLGAMWRVAVTPASMPGAHGVLGTHALSRAAPDGHTLGLVSSQHAINPALYPAIPYNTASAFRPVAALAVVPLVLVTTETFPGGSVAELVEGARANAAATTIGFNGYGGLSHLAGELLAGSAGVRLSHIPFRSQGELKAELVAGGVDTAVLDLATSLAMIQFGGVKALATTGLRRSRLLPDVPTVGETLRGYEATAWIGIIAPTGIPDAVARKIHADAAAILRDPGMVATMAEQGLEVEVLDETRFGARIADDIGRWKRVVETAGVRID